MSGPAGEGPIHLLMITNTLARGGAEAMLVRLACGLGGSAVRPVVVCLRPSAPCRTAAPADNHETAFPNVHRQDASGWARELEARGVPVYEGLLGHKYDVRVLGRFRGLIETYRPAVVMAVGNGGDRMFWGTLAARRAGVPMVVWTHIFPTPEHRTFERVNRWLARWVNAYVALGRRHREALVELEGVPAERIRIIRNGIDVARFAPGDIVDDEACPAKAAGRAKLGVDDPGAVVVGIIANLRSDKRHDVFIDAAARVRRQRDRARFIIIGDGAERTAVRRLAAGHDPDGRYLQLLGERDDVFELIHGLDIVCLTSDWHECLSIAMLEAMAAGKAFVSSRVGSQDEALIDGVTGRFFEPLTAEALAAVLIELIDDPQQRAALGRAAQAKVRAEFTVERMAREFEALVCELAGRVR